MHAFADLDVSVLSTAFTADARFVLSGSDDGNVRVWKANASEKLGVITARERAAIEYRETLKDKWKADQQVGKVQRYVSFPVLLRRSSLTSNSQEPPYTQAGVQGRSAQTDHARGAARQGGEAPEAYSGWRKQAEGGEVEVCLGRAVIVHKTSSMVFAERTYIFGMLFLHCTIAFDVRFLILRASLAL